MDFHTYKLGVSFIRSMKHFLDIIIIIVIIIIFLFSFSFRHGVSWNEQTGQMTYLDTPPSLDEAQFC
jgi:hypothetical protein